MPTTAPSALRFLGWSEEVTPGTPVTPNAWTQPVNDFNIEDKWVALDDTALRGNMADLQGVIQGPKHSEFSFSGPAFLDGLGYLLENILGDVVTSGPVSSSYTHAFSLLNSGTAQPSTLTLVGRGGLTPTSGARMAPGACLSELVLKGNPESTLIEMSAKGQAWATQAYPTAAPANSPTAVAPQGAWRVEIELNDVANLTIRDWQITISRELSVQFTSRNSQDPYIIQRGALGVAGTLYFAKPADESALDYYLNNSQPEILIRMTNGAGANLVSLAIHCQVAAFDSAAWNFSDPAVGFDTAFRGVANTTDAGASGGRSPIKITLGNAVPSY